MKRKLISLLLVFLMCISLLPISAMAGGYSDSNGHWAESEIDKWSGAGILMGSEGSFRPDDYITRAEMATIFDRLMAYLTKADNSFTDLGDSWYTDAILRANAAGLMLGDGDTMRPDDNITRQEAAILVCRAIGLGEQAGSTGFADDADIADWARGFVNALSSAGLIVGVGDNRFAPTDYITRASVVKMLDNAIKDFYSEPGEYSEDADGNVIINSPNVTLKNMKIRGNLILAEGIGIGDITLDNVEIEGEIIDRSSGDDNVHIIDSSAPTPGGGVVVPPEIKELKLLSAEKSSEYVANANNTTIKLGADNTVTIGGTIPWTTDETATTGLGLAAGNIVEVKLTLESIDKDTATATIDGRTYEAGKWLDGDDFFIHVQRFGEGVTEKEITIIQGKEELKITIELAEDVVLAQAGNATATAALNSTNGEMAPFYGNVSVNATLNHEGKAWSEVEALSVALYNEDKLLATNTLDKTLFSGTGKIITSPFLIGRETDLQSGPPANSAWARGAYQIDDELVYKINGKDVKGIPTKDELPTKVVVTYVIAGITYISESEVTLTLPTYVIRKTGTENYYYTNIQDAIKAAEAGDTILLGAGKHDLSEFKWPSGDFKANITLIGGEGVSLVSPRFDRGYYGLIGKDLTFRDINFVDKYFIVNSLDVKNLVIDKCTFTNGAYLQIGPVGERDGITIKDSTFEGVGDKTSILIQGESKNIVLENNTITNAGYNGIQINKLKGDLKIDKNTFETGNDAAIRVATLDGAVLTITNNTISNTNTTGHLGEIIRITGVVTDGTLTGNTYEGKNIVFEDGIGKAQGET